jgi:uncharacterized protein (DUF4415 family)
MARGAKFSPGKNPRQSDASPASRRQGRRLELPLSVALEFYRPLKKPVTLRLDADVIAWFKQAGRRYQTRINAALRKVMEGEMKRG